VGGNHPTPGAAASPAAPVSPGAAGPISPGDPAARGVDRRQKLLLLGLTWLVYASFYLGRKNFSVTKARMASELGLSDRDLGSIDTAYLAAYALGQFSSGFLGDLLGPRRLLTLGLGTAALASATFGVVHPVTLLTACFAVNGLAQATGWPGCNKAIHAWTTPADRGAIMGLWSTCYQVGGLVATALATFLLKRAGYPAAFFVPAAWLALLALVVFSLLPDAPVQPPHPGADTTQGGQLPSPGADTTQGGQLPSPGADTTQGGQLPPPATDTTEQAAIATARRDLLRSVALWSFGASYFCIKLIRYSLLFWLPFYLHKGLGYGEEASGYLSIGFEVGGIAGTIGFGALSDRSPHLPRSRFAAAGLVGLAGALLLYRQLAGLGMAPGFLALCLVGAMLFGPDALLSGTAAQELGGKHATSLAVGVINGTGSLGAILQGYVTVEISRRFGWSALFTVFFALALGGALALAPTLRGRREQA
jgi:sugar phosphate permease